MSDKKETKQAPAVEAGARDEPPQHLKTLDDAIRCVAEAADGIKEACACGDEWPDAEDKRYYDAQVDCLTRLRSMRAALARASEAAAGEPDCWAILTPNGSRLVSPEEAKGRLDAYPLYAAPQPAQAAGEPEVLSDEQIAEIGMRHFRKGADLTALPRFIAAVRDCLSQALTERTNDAAPKPASEQQADYLDTLTAVLNAIGYTEEFAARHPDLKVSEGVKLFLALQNGAIECQAHIGPDCTECGGTGVWTGEQQAAQELSDDDDCLPTPASERAAFNAMLRWHLIRLLQAWRYDGDLSAAAMAAFEWARTNNVGQEAFKASKRAVILAAKGDGHE